MTNRTPPIGTMETRRAEIAGSSVNVEKRTAEICFTTGARVLRSNWSDGRFWEELEVTEKAVDLARFDTGRAPLLVDHDGGSVGSVVGVIESARIAGGKGYATVRFARDAKSEEIFQKVADGILTSISVGYRILKMEKVEAGADSIPVFRATSWSPHEASLIALPADPGAHVRSQQSNPSPGAPAMKTEEQIRTEERERNAGITHACKALGPEGATRAAALIANEKMTLDAARKLVLDELATRDVDEAPASHQRVTGGNDLGDSAVSQRLKLQGEALAARALGFEPSAPARQYMRMTMIDHARHCLEARGVATRLLTNSQIITRATAGDFPNLLQATGDRALMTAYRTATSGVKAIAKKSTAKDFRNKSKLRLSEAPALLPVMESAEIQQGSMSESIESYGISTYGRIFGLTFKAMVNDDLGAFEMIGAFGKAAAEKEAQGLVDLLASNPTMDDGFGMFSTDHGNLAATPAAISITSLGIAMKSLRLMKGLDGTTPLDIVPDRLIVPATQEVAARQYTADLVYASRSDIQPLKLDVLIDPRLDAVSTTAWYMASSANPCLEYSHLEGSEGPQIETEQSFEVLATRFRVTLHWGCGATDWRGMFKNAGA